MKNKKDKFKFKVSFELSCVEYPEDYDKYNKMGCVKRMIKELENHVEDVTLFDFNEAKVSNKKVKLING